MYRDAGGHRQDRRTLQQGQQQPPGQRFSEDSSECPSEAAEERRPQHASGYVLIPGNETRRNEIQRIAREEMENLERWKAANKLGSIKLAPRKLGGIETEAGARQKQQNNLKQSKYQQKFKRDEYRRKMKEEEEAEIQTMKTIQREKADRLEALRQQQEIQRKRGFEVDKYIKNDVFLSGLESGSSYRTSSQNVIVGQESTAWARNHAYQQAQKEEEERNLQQMKEAQHRKSELLKSKQKQEEDVRKNHLQREHRRVNNAFLDRLQGKSQSSCQSGYF